MSDAYERVTVGHTSGGTPIIFNRRTLNRLAAVEDMLDSKLTHFQGSYNRGVTNSAGTHDGGGVGDSWCYNRDPMDVQWAFRKAGMAFAWWRRAIPGVWGNHIHWGILDDKEMSPEAKNQQSAYYNHRDGLKSNYYDSSRRPNPIVVFDYATYQQENEVLNQDDKNWIKAAMAEEIDPLQRALATFREKERGRDVEEAKALDAILEKLETMGDKPDVATVRAVREVVRANRRRIASKIDNLVGPVGGPE